MVQRETFQAFSGAENFAGRANDKLEAHSGFLGLDLDNLGDRLDPLRQSLKNDAHVQVFFTSPSGTGLKVLVRINPDKNTHHRSYLAAKQYVRDTYDIGIDNCPDLARLCFVSYDPDIFIRAEEAVLLEPLPATSNGGEMKRPGVSEEFLRAHGVRHVEVEEAEALLGFKPSCGGLWIPYFNFDLSGEPLIVNGRPYGRLRLDKPGREAKYLTARDSGAQLYVPKDCGPFENELVVAEGEFKSLSLCEVRIMTVAIGGISSAMPGGELLPDVKKLLSRFPSIETVYFLGDADTALNFEFSLEAVKLARALPQGCVLKLPRIPMGGPNGADDRREELGEEFPAFWKQIRENAVEVPVKTAPSALAAELIVAQLPAIANLADWKKRCLSKIVALAGRLEPIALDEVARAVKTCLGISIGAFKGQAARSAKSSPITTAALPTIYFDGVNYFRQNEGKTGYESICRADVILDLRKNGFADRTASYMETSPCEDALHNLQKHNRVDYAGPFCGRPPGLYKEKEVTVLCTQGPVVIEAKPKGEAGPIKDFLESLLGKGRDPFFERQLITIYGWLKHMRTALRSYDQHLPGQILALVGPADCGKSLLQSIITQCLGGRQVDPSGYLVKGSNFNSEMWGAEHQMLGDEEPVGEGRGGVHAFRERLKKAAVSSEYPFQAKFKDGKSARPIWRISLSANDDSEAIAVLPPPVDSFAEKIIYCNVMRRWSRIMTEALRRAARFCSG